MILNRCYYKSSNGFAIRMVGIQIPAVLKFCSSNVTLQCQATWSLVFSWNDYLSIFVHDELDSSSTDIVDGSGSSNGGVTKTSSCLLAKILF